MKAKKARNDANNINTVRNAAEVASQIDEPTAKAIGTGVKVADNLTGGKASEAIGKHMTRGNKFSPGGKIMQGLSNHLAESGKGDKIGSAASRLSGITGGNKGPNVNSAPAANKAAMSSKTPNLSSKSPTENSFLNDNKTETEEMASDGGFTNFTVQKKVLKIGLIVTAISFVGVMFMCLIITASQTFYNAIGLGISDSLNWTTDQEMDEAIGDMDEEDLNDEVTDDEVQEMTYNDVYINNSFKESKLKNYVQIRKTTIIKRPYSDVDIKDIEEFFPSVKNIAKEYDEEMVYSFFFKMYKLHKYYKENYNVNLDLPLLMSTLNLESSDPYEVFHSNLTNDEYQFDYYYDWTATDYKLKEDNSEHDMEVLAQNMVSKQVKEKCVNSSNNITNYNILRDSEIGTVTLTCEEGETYQTEDLGFVLDEDKYDDFLKEFLEKKYYFSGKYKVERNNGEKPADISSNTNSSSSSSCDAQNSFTKYDLTQDQLLQIASLCKQEQGSAEGAAAEASLMANLFEKQGSKYGTGANGLYNYVRNGGWFASAATYMDKKNASPEIVAAVKSVLVDGKRTLPAYVDEHDCIGCGDVTSVTNDGVEINKSDRSQYKQHTSIIKTRYGATYTFYSFPTSTSDPFGYLSEARRKEKGEFHYDYKTGQPVGCSASGNKMADEMVRVALAEINIWKPSDQGYKYNKLFGVNRGDRWCAAFISYIMKNTQVDGVKLYPDVVDYISAGTGSYINYFYNSKKENIKFYFNDKCAGFKGANGEDGYTPKPGDLIFFGWDNTASVAKPDINLYQGDNGLQEHTGMVYKYENDTIYTIEGNYQKKADVFTRSANSCQIIGYGSWYEG